MVKQIPTFPLTGYREKGSGCFQEEALPSGRFGKRKRVISEGASPGSGKGRFKKQGINARADSSPKKKGRPAPRGSTKKKKKNLSTY